MFSRIELAEIQLEEAICVFENYLFHHTVPPVVATKGK